MERREFLEWLVATGGVASLSRLSVRDLDAMGRAAHDTPVAAPVLDARTRALVQTAAERIIPRTDTPGATDAKVTAFIETMLAGWYPAADRERFVRGIAALDAAARTRGAATFVALDGAAQDAVLTTFDDEVATLRRTNGAAANAHWFAMLKYLTVWGYCTSDVGMRETLHSWPPPMRYDGNVVVTK